MKHILILILIVTASSCVTAKKCSIKHPVKPELIIKDSIREVVTYRDTTIYIHLQGEKVTVHDTIFIKDGVIVFKPVNAESKFATARAWMFNNNIFLTITDKDTTLEIKLLNALKNASYWESKYKSEKIIEQVKYIPKFIKFLAWVGGICIGLLLIFVLLKIKKVFS